MIGAAAFTESRLKAWLLAARVPTLAAAVVPVLVGTAAAAGIGRFDPLPFIAALVGSVCIQIGTNYANDAADFLRGADTPQRKGPTRATLSGLLSPRQVMTGAFVCFGIAALVGVYLVTLRGWPLLVAGVLSIASGLAYTGGPWPLGYHGLGEVFVFVFFGVVAVTGSAYVQLGEISTLALAASVPVGLLCTAILVLNNLRDIETDRAAGKRTLAVRMGAPATRALYLVCLVGGVAAPAVIRAAGLVGAWFWLPWLALPLMASLGRLAVGHSDAPALNRGLKRTAQMHLLYGALFAASLLW